VLQDAEFTKLGSNKKVTIDVRVVAATNRDLEAMMLRGEFREDLYYRLKVIEAAVPPLRERRDEIPSLIDFFVVKYSQRYNRPVRPLSEQLRERFLAYDWPGNVRELENMIKRFVILQDEQAVLRELSKPRVQPNPAGVNAPPHDGYGWAPPYQQAPPPAWAQPPQGYGPPPGYAPPPPAAAPVAPAEGDADDDTGEEEAAAPVPGQDGRRLAEVAREAAMAAERTVIADTLRQVHWNRRKAAQILGVSYKTLLNKIKECGISRA
jgi:two-component system, NtrC family, response regulator AtoC